MSSANQVRITQLKETTAGVTPGAGNFNQPRFTSESFSGSPETTESQTIRSDRQSSGQILVAIKSQGDLNFELVAEEPIYEYYESLMFSSFVEVAAVAVDITIDDTAKTITRASGDFTATTIAVGDILELSDFSNAVNNTIIQVKSIDSATVITYIANDELVDETGSGTSYQQADKMEVGTTKSTHSFEKAFLDVSGKALIYRGMLAAQHSLNVSHGSIVTGSFSFQGTNYEVAEASGDFITDGRTIDSQASTLGFNGSLDLIFLADDADGTLDSSSFCLQSIEMSVNNNVTEENCIGAATPNSLNGGTLTVELSMSAYLDSVAFALISKKISQASFKLGFALKNSEGNFFYYLFNGVQLNFDDPSATGINTDVVQAMTGTVKIGPNGESSMIMYKG